MSRPTVYTARIGYQGADALDVVIAVWRHVAATTGAQLGAIRAPEGS